MKEQNVHISHLAQRVSACQKRLYSQRSFNFSLTICFMREEHKLQTSFVITATQPIVSHCGSVIAVWVS